MNVDYVKKLEGVIKNMLSPLRGIPLSLVVEALSNCKIIPFNKQDAHDAELLLDLKKAMAAAGRMFNAKKVKRARPNEIGNDIEPFVMEALNSLGLKASRPKTRSGRMKLTGYPDLQFVDKQGRVNYLECKTFNIKNVATTQRSFYLSPAEDFKVTQDAHHFVVSFEVTKENDGSSFCYQCISWKILSIDQLEVDVKYEFNSDNARLYSEEMVLADGNI